LGCAISNHILWYYRDIKVVPTFFGFLKPSGGVKYDPIMSFLLLSRASGADGTLSRLVSCFQLKNKWRA